MNKHEKMKIATDALQKVIRINKEYCDIEVKYYVMDENMVNNLGNEVVERFHLTVGDEYVIFFKGLRILYVQNVSGDSILTALAEASFLASCKF